MIPKLKTTDFALIPNGSLFIEQHEDGSSIFRDCLYFKESSDSVWKLLAVDDVYTKEEAHDIFVILPTAATDIQPLTEELKQEINNVMSNHIKYGTECTTAPPEDTKKPIWSKCKYSDILETNTLKGTEWLQFARKTLQHVDFYSVPQYHDYDHPEEQIHSWNIDDFKKAIMRYALRIGSGQRGIEEAKRDCLKIAHFACFLHTWYEKEESEK